MSFRLTAICDLCGREQDIKQLPDHPGGWAHEIAQEGWAELDERDVCGACWSTPTGQEALAADLRAAT